MLPSQRVRWAQTPTGRKGTLRVEASGPGGDGLEAVCVIEPVWNRVWEMEGGREGGDESYQGNKNRRSRTRGREML